MGWRCKECGEIVTIRQSFLPTIGKDEKLLSFYFEGFVCNGCGVIRKTVKELATWEEENELEK